MKHLILVAIAVEVSDDDIEAVVGYPQDISRFASDEANGLLADAAGDARLIGVVTTTPDRVNLDLLAQKVEQWGQ